MCALLVQIKALEGSPYKWLGEMLRAFNHGDLHAYDALCSRHAAQQTLPTPDCIVHSWLYIHVEQSVSLRWGRQMHNQ